MTATQTTAEVADKLIEQAMENAIDSGVATFLGGPADGHSKDDLIGCLMGSVECETSDLGDLVGRYSEEQRAEICDIAFAAIRKMFA